MIFEEPFHEKTQEKKLQALFPTATSYGLLEKAFRPQDEIVVLRGFVRQRQNLIAYASQHIQHMQKALVEMNLKLTLVVSDIVGKTGMAIIKAILAGRREIGRAHV